MTLATAFEPIMNLNREIVLRNTWGHLAPKLQTKYKGYIIVAVSSIGDSLIFDYDFEGLEGNPWSHEDICEFGLSENFPHREAALYRFDGTYTKFKNGNCRFTGKFTQVYGAKNE